MPDTTTRWHYTTWLLEAPFYDKYDAIARGKQKTAQKVDLQSTHSGIKSILRSWSGYYRKTLGTAAPQRGNSTPQIRLYTSLLREGYKGGRMNQYWSLIGAVLVRNMYQYWSELRPVLVNSVTSTGWKTYPISEESNKLPYPILLHLEARGIYT